MARSPNDSMREVYARAGEALNSWSQIEDLVLALYMSCISARNHDAARAGYMAVVAFEAKLAATNAVAKLALARSPSHLEQWIAIQL